MSNQKGGSVTGAAFIIAGTCIGGGMLALPSVTGESGFFPALLSSGLCWLYMTLTGLFLLEACLWSRQETPHVASIARTWFGTPGKITISILFFFLYECLLISYISGGAPYFRDFLELTVGLPEGKENFLSYSLFGLLTGAVIFPGTKWLDRLNFILMAGLIAAFVGLVLSGSQSVQANYLARANWSHTLTPLPVLVGAFGYHNIVPTLVPYLNRDPIKIRKSLFLGTLIPLVIYTVWQWLTLGSVPQNVLEGADHAGKVPVIEALVQVSQSPSVKGLAYGFTFFAITTSMLGVAFSMLDFISDLFQKENKGKNRVLFCMLTLLPPLIISSTCPNLFVTVFSFAAGFGEAALNGLFPAAVLATGLFRHNKSLSNGSVKGIGPIICVVMVLTSAIMVLEALFLMSP